MFMETPTAKSWNYARHNAMVKYAKAKNIESVSYTHLDVYKRQAWRTVAIIYAIIGLIVNTISALSVKELPEEELNAVSYTHLSGCIFYL